LVFAEKKNVIQYGRQSISEQDIQAVIDVLHSDFLTQGPAVSLFESAVSTYTTAKYGVAANSATSALHLACMALGLGVGDILWTTPITFVASANCALYCGASVDFVDIDPLTYNVSVEALSQKLSQAEKLGKLPKVVIPVHLCGLSCDMEAINKLSKKYGFSIIEDASHAIGGKYQGSPVGSCQFSDITIFSFHPVKIMTTGEGGMAITNDQNLAEKMQLLRSHGITRDPEKMINPTDEPWNYEQIDLGFNYRITDMQAALGTSQLKRVDKFVARRHEISHLYGSILENMPVQTQYYPDESYSGMHLYVIRINKNKVNKSQKQIFIEMREAGIGVNLHYIPIYNQPYYKKMGFSKQDFPEAERYYEEALTLPLYPDLDDGQIDKVVSSLANVLSV
jgi:UDP-4-amino-4,6-dideoxy-N-acetyl-beta-L-altrosamine transaminase